MEVCTSQVAVFQIGFGQVCIFEVAALEVLAVKIQGDEPASGEIAAGGVLLLQDGPPQVTVSAPPHDHHAGSLPGRRTVPVISERTLRML